MHARTMRTNNMRRLRILLGGLLLGTALIAPIMVRADGDDHPYNKQYYEHKRYYDRDGRDYHVWNAQEHNAYRFYLNDQHKEYREVCPLVGAFHGPPFAILLVLVVQVEAVSIMLLGVPHVIVAAVAVVVSLVFIVLFVVRVVVTVSPHHYRGDQCGAQQEPT